jgi:membrane protease subunit (stomatin/prohibitin family)
MGLIRAAVGTIGGTLADQWLEAIEPAKIDNTILATYGVSVSRRKNARGSNRKGTEDVISNGSINVKESTLENIIYT